MEDVNNEKVYILGSRLNDVESVIIEGKKKPGVIGFNTLELAKNSFRETYDLLLAPKFTPSFPPSKEEMKYHTEFMQLISFSPVFVELDRKNASDIIKAWIDQGSEVFETEDKFLQRKDYLHVPMRTGFLEKFGVLDIVKDIETTPFVGPDGKLVHRVNKRTFGPIDNLQNQLLSQKEIDAIFKKRGYL